MRPNSIDAISQEVSQLDIHDEFTNPPPFAAYNPDPPPTPKLHSKGVIATDITTQFVDAAQKLNLGQLVCDPHFTLFESVGALEIMDPKMDSGFLAPGETMEDEYDFSQALLPEEVLGIIDQLLCHEMAWHIGHPLSQTIFTSLYIDRLLSPTPFTLENTYFDRSESCSLDEPLTLRILRAYCLGLIKTCWYVNSRVRSEHYYEEEDFVTHTFNRSLLEGIEHNSILELLEETLQTLADTDTIPKPIKEALISRLKFRSTFLKAVDLADSRESQDVKKLWEELLSVLPEIENSAKLSKPVPESFSVKIQRKLASTIPPRPIVQVGLKIALGYLERLCRDGSIVIEVLNYYDSQSLITFVSLFQARTPQPLVYIRTLLQHYIFGDMIMLGHKSIREILDDDLATITLPASLLLDRANDEIEVPTDPRFLIASRVELFRQRAASSYLDILRAFCQNRCRIRRTLCHTIVDWDSVQLDAEELDVELRALTKEKPISDRTISDDPIYAFPLSSWAYYYKLLQMEWIVSLGFELETYAPSEMAGMYWYLQYLCKTRSSHLERIRGFTMRAYTSFSRSSSSSPSPSQTSIATEKEYMKSLSFINFSILQCAATISFADSLSALYEVLRRLSLLPSPSSSNNPNEPQYTTSIMRHELRFKPFSSIGLPSLPSFADFTAQVTQPGESTLTMLEFAADAQASAKKGFEILGKLKKEESFCRGSAESWVKDVKGCLKACIFAGIAVAGVKKAWLESEKRSGERNGNGNGKVLGIKVEIPETGKGYHAWWVVPKIIPVPP